MDTEQRPLESGLGPGTIAEEVAAGADLSGKVVVITGGHSGIGLETTRVLSDTGASIIVGARDLKKAHDNLSGIRDVEVIPLELSDPGSIDRFADTFLGSGRPVDILINNAGIMATPLMRDSRNYEMQFATNHLGHFQLTVRLWQALKDARNARVVTLSSFGHRFAGVDLEDPNFLTRPYDKWVAYGQSKSANSLFSVDLDRRGREHGIRAFAVHPGRIIDTDLVRYMTDEEREQAKSNVLKSPPGVGMKNIAQGAATTVWCAISPLLDGRGGVYCADCDISELVADDSPLPSGVRRWAVDKPTAGALWTLSEGLTGYTL